MSNAVEALGVALDLLNAAINLTMQLQKVSDMIATAKAEGRDLTDEELASLKADRLAARKDALDA